MNATVRPQLRREVSNAEQRKAATETLVVDFMELCSVLGESSLPKRLLAILRPDECVQLIGRRPLRLLWIPTVTMLLIFLILMGVFKLLPLLGLQISQWQFGIFVNALVISLTVLVALLWQLHRAVVIVTDSRVIKMTGWPIELLKREEISLSEVSSVSLRRATCFGVGVLELEFQLRDLGPRRLKAIEFTFPAAAAASGPYEDDPAAH
ncbi:MAG TPA: hypothetical protein VGA99_04730 [bacterium]